MILADIARERMQLAQLRRVVKQQPAGLKPPESEPEPAPQMAPRDLLYQQVTTSYGAGKVVQVFTGRVAVILDSGKVEYFDGCGPPEKWKRVKIIGRE
jgi:hypothetical protein